MTTVPTAAAGDLPNSLLDDRGQPDVRLTEAIGSAANALALERSMGVRFHAGALAGETPEVAAELPQELIAELGVSADSPPDVIRNYFAAIPPDDHVQRRKVLTLLLAAGETWRPLLEETALRILETPNSSDRISTDEFETLRIAAQSFAPNDEDARIKLWTQIQPLHPEPEVREALARALRIDFDGTQSDSGALN